MHCHSLFITFRRNKQLKCAMTMLVCELWVYGGCFRMQFIIHTNYISFIAKCHNFRFDYLFTCRKHTHTQTLIWIEQPKSNTLKNTNTQSLASHHTVIICMHWFFLCLAREEITIFGKYRCGLFTSLFEINNFLCFHNLFSTFSNCNNSSVFFF